MKKKSKKTIFEVKKAEEKTQYIQVPFEVKLLADVGDEFFRFEGLASTFGNIDLVDDIVQPGAFKESILEKLPIILWQHDMQEPIGMPEEIRETDAGLFVRIRLPKSDDLVKGRVMPQMKVGSIRTMSIGFRTKTFSIDQDTGIRELIKVDLKEISLVTFAANPLAVVTGFKDEHKEIVGAERAKEISTKRDFERCLRESGMFTKDAACILAKYFHGEHESTTDKTSEDEQIDTDESKDTFTRAVTDLSLKFEHAEKKQLIKTMFLKLGK